MHVRKRYVCVMTVKIFAGVIIIRYACEKKEVLRRYRITPVLRTRKKKKFMRCYGREETTQMLVLCT